MSKQTSKNGEYCARFQNLAGSLNLWELDYRMDANESPEMKNLWWRDGLLGCRDGQEYVSETPLGLGLAAYDGLYWGHCVVHVGGGVYAGVPGPGMVLTKLWEGLPEVRGTFFRYRDALFYKTRGAFLKITWDGQALSAGEVEAYVPTTVINCDPETGAGDLYQPENRLSYEKRVEYNAGVDLRGLSFLGTGAAVTFTFTVSDGEPVSKIQAVYLDGAEADPASYTVGAGNLSVTFQKAPASGQVVDVLYAVGLRVYKLPVEEVDSIVSVTVDGETTSDWTADLQTGTITFRTAPPVQDPPQNNTVSITYKKADEDARKSIMDCVYASTFGGTGGAVLVLAGSEAQPNAYFWNSSHIAMDPGYFPYQHYNLAGDNLEPVTGFGRQAGYLVVFKSHALGRCQLGTQMIGDRAYLKLDYTPINAALGCDLPWTIQLVRNNLTWCSTYAGVCLLQDTTAALENVVVCISRNIAGCDSRPGLLHRVRQGDPVCALDDGERYWVTAGGGTYVWDYGLSSPQRPSWFYFTNIPAVAFFRGDSLPRGDDGDMPFTGARRIYHLDGSGRVSRFVRSFRDYGGAIEKVYQFATQDFGGYDRLKNVHRCVLTTRSDTDTVIRILYETDHEARRELTPIESYSWRLTPRNLKQRVLAVRRFAHVAVRKPACRHIRHFTMRLENSEPGCDMSVVGAEVYFTYRSRER